MDNVEFLAYQPTPNEKHMGVASIRVDKRFIFRFKIMQNPKGEGLFANPAPLKIGEQYYPGFQFDSSYEADEIKKFIISHVKRALNVTSMPSQAQAQNYFTPTPIQNSPPQSEFNFDQPPF